MASRRQQRRKQCGDKGAYGSKAAALDDAYAISRRQDQRVMNVYCCRHCHSWHFGHPPGRVRQSLAAKRRNRAG